MSLLGPRRMVGGAVRALAVLGRAPVVGRLLRRGTMASLGLGRLRKASLGPTPPHQPGGPPLRRTQAWGEQ